MYEAYKPRALDFMMVASFALAGFLLTQSIISASQPAHKSGHASSQWATEVSSSASTSLNWSGYVAKGGTYSEISATWTVPTIDNTSNSSLMADATWVGIGGVEQPDLIQVGTQTVADQKGDIVYQAWFETIPDISQVAPLTVQAGDSVTASLSKQDGDLWLIDISNNTTGKSYETTIRYSSSLSSAEWVQEMPSSIAGNYFIPLDKFGSINFLGGSTIDNGVTKTIAESGAQPLTMVSLAGDILAIPTSLTADGAGFNVDRTDAIAQAALARPQIHIIYFSRSR